jgi:hypothetical protein
VLVTVTNTVSKHPTDLYRFLKQDALTHIQFNLVVERVVHSEEKVHGLTFAQPGKGNRPSPQIELSWVRYCCTLGIAGLVQRNHTCRLFRRIYRSGVFALAWALPM